ncbi:MAG: NAD(P)-binding domain-containing protein [Candidatus Dormibacteraeota bacterium]|nr:NAD(P)-binding domain-containing protein [Candidatus Dormibacteraeota bacterium]
MRIAVIGAGNIGGTLGGKWAAAGHEVVYGLRDPAQNPAGRPFAEALEGADAVLLALPGTAVVDFVRAQAGGLDGKVVVDATNNIRAPEFNSLPVLAATIPAAHIYRAFNSLGWDVLAEPEVGGVQADMFYAGPEGRGQQVVESLIADAGLRPVRVGGIDKANVVDGVLALWFTLSGTRGRRIAFSLVQDPA